MTRPRATPETPVPQSAMAPPPGPASLGPAPVGLAPPGLLTPAGWAAMAAGVLVVAAILGVAVFRRAMDAPAPNQVLAPVPAASSDGLASAQALSAGGSTVYRQVDPMAIAAENNPALTAQMARNRALAAALPPAVAPAPHASAGPRIEVEPSQGAGTVSQARGPAGGGSVVGRSDRAGPALPTGPAQGTAVAPPATPLPDSPKP